MAAILFPVFAKAREKARQSSCASNLKQIGLSIMQYCQDYDETYPGYAVGGLYWVEIVYPYMKNIQVVQCPSRRGSGQIWPGPGTGSSACAYGFSYSGGGYSYATMAQIKRPAETIVVGESYNVHKYNPRYDPADNGAQYTYKSSTGVAGAPAPHNDGENVVFGDGHVKWMSTKELGDPAAANTYWNALN